MESTPLYRYSCVQENPCEKFAERLTATDEFSEMPPKVKKVFEDWLHILTTRIESMVRNYLMMYFPDINQCVECIPEVLYDARAKEKIPVDELGSTFHWNVMTNREAAAHIDLKPWANEDPKTADQNIILLQMFCTVDNVAEVETWFDEASKGLLAGIPKLKKKEPELNYIHIFIHPVFDHRWAPPYIWILDRLMRHIEKRRRKNKKAQRPHDSQKTLLLMSRTAATIGCFFHDCRGYKGFDLDAMQGFPREKRDAYRKELKTILDIVKQARAVETELILEIPWRQSLPDTGLMFSHISKTAVGFLPDGTLTTSESTGSNRNTKGAIFIAAESSGEDSGSDVFLEEESDSD